MHAMFINKNDSIISFKRTSLIENNWKITIMADCVSC